MSVKDLEDYYSFEKGKDSCTTHYSDSEIRDLNPADPFPRWYFKKIKKDWSLNCRPIHQGGHKLAKRDGEEESHKRWSN